MKSIYTSKIGSFSFFLFFSVTVIAQNSLWQNVSDVVPSTLGEKQTNTRKQIIYKLDTQAIKSFLSSTSLESTQKSNTGSILELPLPDGSFMKFAVSESPIMETELALKFPEIKTYSGYSLSNPAITARFDFTPQGFHAMILSTEGTFFIDPYNNKTSDYYTVYDKVDAIGKNEFSCGFEEENKTKDDPLQQNSQNRIAAQTETAASIGDGVLRTYRLALAATGEYTSFHGGTIAGALAAQVTTMNRVNGIYLKELGVKMIIIGNNDLIIYTDADTDPYANFNGVTMLTQNANNLSTVIGNANFDIGHVFSTGGGGIAGLGVVCSSLKARGVTGLPAPVGDVFNVDFVAHEIGHQFRGNHTFNGNVGNCSGGNRNSATAFEPGSGVSIMAYAGICGSQNVLINSLPFFHGASFTEMHSFINGAANACAAKPAHTNAAPVITTHTPSQTIPKGTPIILTGSATDADGNASLTYGWDQMNLGAAGVNTNTSTNGPLFRSFLPNSSGTRYIPNLTQLAANVTSPWEVLSIVNRPIDFRLLVRDNNPTGGANDHVNITLTVDASSGPFVVTVPNASGISYTGLSSQIISWDVAGTNTAPVNCTKVDILLSTDGGLNFPYTLASNVANTGSYSVIIPNVSSTQARIMVRGSDRAFFNISNYNFEINCPTSVVLASPTDNYSSGSVIRTASSVNGKISATNNITLAAKVTYLAKAIELNPGFSAINGAVFLAQTGGCTN